MRQDGSRGKLTTWTTSNSSAPGQSPRGSKTSIASGREPTHSNRRSNLAKQRWVKEEGSATVSIGKTWWSNWSWLSMKICSYQELKEFDDWKFCKIHSCRVMMKPRSLLCSQSQRIRHLLEPLRCWKNWFHTRVICTSIHQNASTCIDILVTIF